LQSDQSDYEDFPFSLQLKSDGILRDPYTVPAITSRVSLIHPDSGASVSIIRKSIAEQLNTPIFKLSNPLRILDINQGVKSHDEVCYIQIEIPEVSSFRAVVLCIVKKESHIPFLLSMTDQAAYRITPQADTREITLGGERRCQAQGKVKFLCYDEWSQGLNRPLKQVSSTQLALQNRSLLRQTNKSKTYSTFSPRIEILSHSGMFQQRIRQPSSDTTKISSEEIRQAIQHAPLPHGPRAAAVQTLDHQVQLLVTEPKISRDVDTRRKYEEWRESNEVQQLQLAKMDSSNTDEDISRYTREALQSGLKTFYKVTPFISSTTISEASEKQLLSEVQLSSLTEYMECFSTLRDKIADNELKEDITIDTSNIPIYSNNLALSALNAYLISTSPTLNPNPETPIYEIHNQESVDSVNNQVQLDEEGVLTPNKYDREYLSVYAGQFKPSKVPSKPVKQVIEDEVKCHLTEDEFLDKDFVPLQSIAELNDIIYDSERLQKMQQVEHKIILNDPSRKEELEMELVMVKAEYCKELNLNAKPEDFPIDLWSYVFDDQKELVASRFALFTNEVRTTLISDIMEKLDISKQFGDDLERYMRAQALANLDVFGYPDPYDQPTIPGYTFRIQTIHENPIYLPTQRFNQQETAFLEARLYELVNVAKVEQAPKSPHNLPLVLVPYTDRIKDSITKWTEKGLNPAEEMFKPSNYKEVAQWYRLTNNLKALNDITIPYRYPMPDQNDPKHFTKGSRYWSVTDIKDAFFCINLHPDDRDKTAFTTPRGRFRFTVMPQGATNSPPFFANVAQDTFSHIPKSELLNFIDDTTNHSRSLCST